MKAVVAPLEGNKVKLSIEVEEREVDQAVDETFKKLSKELRVPGFRPGKVPRPVLEARVGKPAVRHQAIDDHVPYWYEMAVRDNAVDVIAEPEVEVTAGADDGGLSFDAVVEVRPQLKLTGYQSLKITVPNPVVSDDDVQAQVDRLRGNFGQLAQVEREAQTGDSVVVDMSATQDGKALAGMTYSDYSVEVGAGNDLPELDEHLVGAHAGQALEFDADLGGERPVQVKVQVKQVQEKVLPEETDEWASEASEFSTAAELRADIRKRLGEIKRANTAMTLRNGAVEALVALVDEEPPSPLVEAEVRRAAEQLGQRLDAQGIPIKDYLAAIGRSLEEVVAELRAQAVPNVKADLALRAVAEAEALIPSEAEVDQFMETMAAQAGVSPAAARLQVERAGRLSAVRSDLQKSKAFDWLIEHAEVVDEEGQPVDRSLLEPPESQAASQGAPAPDEASPGGDE